MGPMRTISGMVQDIREQISEIGGITERMRSASRRLTGGTGMAPVPIAPQDQSGASIKGEPPLLAQLTIALNDLNSAVSDMRNEIIYFEAFSETGEPRDRAETAYAASSGATKSW